MSVRLSPLWTIQSGLRPSQLCLKHEAWLAGWLGLRSGWLGLRPGWMAQRGGQTDGRTNERTENLPILQDLVPYRGRCPASPMKTKEKVEQSKGTADHLMPLGYFFFFFFLFLFLFILLFFFFLFFYHLYF